MYNEGKQGGRVDKQSIMIRIQKGNKREKEGKEEERGGDMVGAL